MNRVKNLQKFHSRRRVRVRGSLEKRPEWEASLTELVLVGPYENRILWQPDMMNQRGQGFRSLSGFRLG